MQCRNHAALAAFCFCLHRAVRMDVVCHISQSFVSRKAFRVRAMMRTHACRSTRYSTAGSYLFLSFVTYTFAGLSCTRTASFPGCAKRNGRKRAKL
jgi:hypothetical protein